MKKTWKEKLHDSKGFPKIEEVTEGMNKSWGEGTFVIPAPIEVDEIMRKIPKGNLITISEIRNALAQKHKVNFTCPLTTGIFAWISANAAEEERAEGKKKITPYWRTLKSCGLLNEKYPGGFQEQIKLLEGEGFTVVPKGKNNFRVVGYEKYLAKITL